jgi:hypothetical protein
MDSNKEISEIFKLLGIFIELASIICIAIGIIGLVFMVYLFLGSKLSQVIDIVYMVCLIFILFFGIFLSKIRRGMLDLREKARQQLLIVGGITILYSLIYFLFSGNLKISIFSFLLGLTIIIFFNNQKIKANFKS